MRPLSKVNFIVIHCADTKSTMDVAKADLYKWHVTENGWSDIGYHHFIKFDGATIACRSEEYTGAHCKSVNDKSLAICLEGGFSGEYNFTKPQLTALKTKIKQIKSKHPNAAIVGHSHFDDKECPSFDVVQWWEAVK